MADKRQRRVRPLKRLLQSNAMRHVLAALMAAYIWLVYHTTRWERHGEAQLEAHIKEYGSIICVFWHARLLMMPICWRKEYGPLQAMVSRHRDGAFIGDICRYFGMESVKGSTGKGGASALRGALQALENGSSLTMTPDGPRGPREQVQPGVVTLAQKTGAAIFPVSYSVRWGMRAQSWDRFLVPFPFGRGSLRVGQPLVLDADDNFDMQCQHVQQALQEVTITSDTDVGRKLSE